MESGRQKLNLRSKSIWKIGKTNIAVMADKVELNVDENQAICPSKIDFMQKYPSETHIKKRLKACSSFVTGCPELCNYNMETKCSFFQRSQHIWSTTPMPTPSNFPGLAHSDPMSIFSSVTHFLRIFSVRFLLCSLFCHAFAFSTNLTFVLLRSPLQTPTHPLFQPVYVLEFFVLLLAFHQSHSLFHIASVSVFV